MTDLMQAMMAEDEFLEHYGVKGMKWGRKKAPANPSHTSADAARVNKIKTRVKKNGLDNLSNDDIAKLNKRNQLISEYKKANPGKVKKGSDAVKSALEAKKNLMAVVAVGTAVATHPLTRKVVKTVVDNLKG